MRKIYIFLNFVGLLLTINQTRAEANTAAALDVPVKVVEVRDLGISDRDESKSVIEVRWQVNQFQKEKIASFNLLVAVTYADGTTINERRKAQASEFSARIEVPSVRALGGRSSAFIKKLEARVTAVISKN